MPLRLRIVSSTAELPAAQCTREFARHGGTIGRAADNDWTLPDARRYVSSRHAVIDYQAGAYYLVDTSRNGVYVNGADTPVGQGHPQRLFDGDQLRIGEFEIAVDISESDEDPRDDGMRDSIVRAQLVPEDQSVELQLVDEDKLLGNATLQRHLSPGTGASSARNPRASAAAAAPTPAPARPAAAKPAAAPARPAAAAPAIPASAAPARPAAAKPAAPPRLVAGTKVDAPAPRGALASDAGQAARPRAAAPEDADAPIRQLEGDPRAIAQFLAAAGLKPDSVTGATSGEVMMVAGKLLRLCIGGLMEVLRNRSHMKDTFRLPQTVMQAAQNNPLKFSPSVDEALRYLLSDRTDGAYLSAEEAVKTAFRDVRQHEQAVVNAMLQAVRDYVDRFDPEELKPRFDKGLKRGGLLASANKLKYWELYEESYPALTQSDEGGAPQLFNEEFARAYTQEVEAAQAARTRQS